ncbi:MAG: flagellar basal-body MS-ring/collar protein FliF [Pseudomonadaceae bacterium]|nr:flagellar basal-body MS-ring/collar protein FliF [Pseudomonadaceae bacterium]
MAELPVQSPATALDSSALPGGNFIRGAVGMPVVRQVTLLVALAASVSLGVFATQWMQDDTYKPLGTPVSAAQTGEIAQSLEDNMIDYRLDPNSGMVLIAAEDLHRARMLLAGAELLGNGKVGYALLDEEQGFGVSQFMENARHRRSVEGELAKNIEVITSVQSAAVLLATPKTSSFIRDRRKPSASVTVTLKPGRTLDSAQIRGITNLVAGAVPELDAADVVVVDQSGFLLSEGSEDQSLRRSQQDMALVRAHEQALQSKIANILTPWVGGDRFSAEVNATMDFTRSQESEELYNPDLVALRSEQRSEEQNVGSNQVAAGVPGTLSNQPPEFGAVNPEAQAEEKVRSSSVRSTRNYEVDRTLSYTEHQVGRVTRLSVTVVVDDQVSTDPETGEAVAIPWAPEEIDHLTQAVQTAVGFRADRGDSVSVVNRAFYRPPVAAALDTPIWAESWFVELIKQVLGGIAIIIVIFGLLRPLFKNLSQAGEMVREQQSLAIADMTQIREAALSEAVPGLPSPINLGGDETSAQKMETVRNLIGEDPNRVAQVVKHWVSEDE